MSFLQQKESIILLQEKKGVRFLLNAQDIPILAKEGRRQQAQEIYQGKESLGP